MHDQRQSSIALLWLIAADLDPSNPDTQGERLDASLAGLLTRQFATGRRQAAAAVLADRPLPPKEGGPRTAHVWLFNANIDAGRHDSNGDTLDVSLARLLDRENDLGRQEATGIFEQAQPASSRRPPSGEYEVGNIGHNDPTGSYRLLPDGMVEKLLDIAS